MNDFLDQIRTLSPQRLALLAVKLKEQLDSARRLNDEPIAVIGIGCRLPGADGPNAYWDLLKSGREGIAEVPAARWPIDEYFDSDPDAPGMMSVRSGGFLDEVDKFDPAFFGITPREAAAMDPQQRLLLEVSWEALENAGVAPTSLVGSKTGVYVGLCGAEYLQLLLGRGAPSIDVYMASGNASSVASGRLSYTLGLQGPCMTIDTSCSASLVAIHQACQSLRLGESSLALAGGANVMCAPEITIALSKGRMLAADGRCKTFDAAADGYARGEGCGIVVLKRLSDAKRDGDRILALIRGSAVNQDGKSGGLTVPNGPAQESVIREALAAAGLEGSNIDYVEAHGTGTSLGDPIEVRSLARVLGEGRNPERPLLIGSVKTNIGHLEAAAGVAGFLKVVLALQHETLPKHLNFKNPNPFIEWANLPVAVVDEGKPWTRSDRPRRAGISSFGFSGTNAHIILEEAPAADPTPVETNDRPLHCLTVSARSESSLDELTRRYAGALAPENDLRLADVAHVAATGRSHLTHRMAIVAADSTGARDALLAALAGKADPRIRRGKPASGQSTEVVFLYTGAGAQYPGMARELYRASPVFRDAIDHCDKLLGPDAKGRTLKSVFWESTEDEPSIHEIGWTQPAMFAIEYALTTLWRSWGVTPAAVIGHSVGEYAAACAAGVFSVEDGLRLIAERGRLMQSLPPGGMMAALFAPIDEIEAAIAPMRDRVAIAAINGPGSVVISGEAPAVEAVLADFAKRNVIGQKLFVSLAAHSPLMEPLLDRMEALAASVAMSPPAIPIAWNLTGRPLPNGTAPDARYWRQHMREPVRFADGIKALHDDGFRIFLEVGPHPTLLAFTRESLPGEDSLLLTSLRRGKNDWNELVTSLADLHVHGVPVDFAGFDRPYSRRRVTIPTYAFDRQRYWAAPTPRPGRDAAEVPTAVEGTTDSNGLFYKIAWEPAEKPPTNLVAPGELAVAGADHAGPDQHRKWVVLSDGGEVAPALVAALEAAGDAVEPVEPRVWRAALGSPETVMAQKWWPGRIESRDELPVDIIHLGALETDPQAASNPDMVSREAFVILQAAASLRSGRLWLVTRGTQEVRGFEDVVAPEQAGLWGLGRTFGLEHPASWGGVVDADPTGATSDVVAAVLEMIRDPKEDQSAWRNGTRYIPRIAAAEAPVSSSYNFRPDVSYLITGGLGGLGRAAAEWMASHGGRHLVLINRTPVPAPEEWLKHQDDERIQTLIRLRDAGVTVETAAVDVRDEVGMAALMGRFGREWPSLGGVLHAVVVATGAPMAEMPAEMFDATLHAKVSSNCLIERLSANQPLEFFVDFSTTTALLGSVGLAHYAAANAILDALACRRRAQGKPALSVNWGAWDRLNVDSKDRERIVRGGLTPMPVAVGLAALESLLAVSATRAIVADVDWAALRAAYESRRPQPLLSRIATSDAAVPSSATEDADVLPPNINLMGQEERRAVLDQIVRRVVAGVIGLKSPESIDAALSLFKMGLDSLMAIQVQRRLERATAETLPAAFAFNYPTLDAMVELLDSGIAARVPAAGEIDASMDLLSRVDELSAEEIDALLSQMAKESVS